MKSLLGYDKVMMAELGLLSVCDHNPWQKQLKAGKIYFGPWYQKLSVLCVQESTEKVHSPCQKHVSHMIDQKAKVKREPEASGDLERPTPTHTISRS